MSKFIPTSGFGYEVWHTGHIVGHVGRAGRKWVARSADFDLGEHKTRDEAAAALIDVDSQ